MSKYSEYYVDEFKKYIYTDVKKQGGDDKIKGGGKYNIVAEHEKNSLGIKIAQARKERKLSLKALCDRLESCGVTVGPSAVSNWETGLSVPNGYQLMALCQELGIMNPYAFFVDSSAEILNDTALNKIEEYRNDLIASGRYARKKETVRFEEIPISIYRASAGTGAFVSDENFEKVQFAEDVVPKGTDFGIHVSGDSMEPRYVNGQLVFIQKTTSLNRGDIGLFLVDGEGYIKMYDECDPDENIIDEFTSLDGVVRSQPVLVSLNSKYAPKKIIPGNSFEIVGKVLN